MTSRSGRGERHPASLAAARLQAKGYDALGVLMDSGRVAPVVDQAGFAVRDSVSGSPLFGTVHRPRRRVFGLGVRRVGRAYARST